ncbi:MAG: manganese efflux pump MntP [Solirubrobacteraceae bacterium]
MIASSAFPFALAFGLFEAGMRIVGLLVGREVSHALGSQAHLIGGGLLIATDVYAVVQTIQTSEEVPSAIELRGGRLVVTAASRSVDNLLVGSALGAYHLPPGVAVSLIAVISVGLSLIGLELGTGSERALSTTANLSAGVVLIGVWTAIAAEPH